HALMEALIEDENAMDKGVADTVKYHKIKHDDDDDGDDDDEGPSGGPNQGKQTKRRRTKESESSKKLSSIEETPKGKAPTKDSKTGKSASSKEPVKEPIAEQPPRPPNPDPEWNKRQVVLDQPEQPWFNQLVSASKDPFTFNDLMATPIDFSNTIKHVYDKDVVKGIKHWGERRKLWYRSQIGVKSYQKKRNITKPQRTFTKIELKEPYTSSYNPPRIVYKNLNKQKRVLRADELYKYVRDEMHHRVLNFRLDYNTEMLMRKWTAVDQRRAGLMIELIDSSCKKGKSS
nr:hypothetical protein [Tanacetum cinerariifolium]